MTYLRVKWKHDYQEEPVLLYSELNDQRWEVRKVEIFRDGRKGFAASDASALGTKLGMTPIPTIDAIAADPQFEPLIISKEDFENIWETRLK